MPASKRRTETAEKLLHPAKLPKSVSKPPVETDQSPKNPPKPLAPWATRVVTKRKGKHTETAAVELVHARDSVPWAALEKYHAHPEDLAYLGPAKWEEKPEPQEEAEEARPTQNYAAVDPEGKLFGLIDQGLADPRCRSLTVHVRRNRVPWPILNAIRPGVLLQARLPRSSQTVGLRVRFTTPARYYSPGAKVSTLAIGVDESDWRSLMAHRI